MDEARATGSKRRIAVLLIVGLVAGLVALVAGAQPAAAAVSSPAPGSTVSGVVQITEARGGTNGSALLVIPCSGAWTRIEVFRLNAAGQSVEQVFSKQQTHGAGNLQSSPNANPITMSWNSVGHPIGNYRIRSTTADGNGGILSCPNPATAQAPVVRSDFTVRLENGVVAAATLPSSHIAGEPLTIPLLTRVEATGAVLPNRQVQVTIPGIGSATTTTGADGTGAVTIDIPHQAAGSVTIELVTTGDAFFAGRATSRTLLLTPRPTKITWTGDLRGEPGATARLEARITDATAGSDQEGQPVVGVPLTITFGSQAVTGTSDADGRVAASAALTGHPRQEDVNTSFEGDSLWAPSSRTIVFIVGDDVATPSPTRHGLVGGLLGLVGGLITKPTVTGETVLTLIDSALPNLGIDQNDIIDVDAPALDSLLQQLLGGVATELTPLGASVDAGLDALLKSLADAPIVGEVAAALPYEWRSVYVAPNGERVLNTFSAVLAVPTPLDVDSDGLPDVMANLTLRLTDDDRGLNGLPLLPVIKVHRLANAPAELPLSLQAILSGGGLVTVDGAEGRLRFGYDTRLSNAPGEFEARLSVGEGGFDIEVLTEDGEDIAVTGAIEGGSLDLPFGGFEDPDAPSFEDPEDPAPVGTGETRFGIGFSPAPSKARVGLALGGEGADVGATFDTNRPTKVGLEFVQDSGADELFTLTGVFDAVDGRLAMTVSGEEGEPGGIAPNLGLQFASENPLDRLAIRARGLAGGDITTELLLSLTDVPTQVSFGSGSDGRVALSAPSPIGIMEAGFSANGPIVLLDDEAFLYLKSEGDYQSVALRLLGVTSLMADLSAELGLDIVMAPGRLRTVAEADGLAVDARIYEAPSQLHLGLAADGAFEIEGSEPIDLVAITISDQSGILLGATDVDVRIEDVPRGLSVALEGEEVTFASTHGVIGRLEMFATSGPEPVLGSGEGLALTLTDEEFVLAARMNQLRKITADVDLGAPAFLIDTLSDAVFQMDMNITGLEISGVIDHLVPNLRMEVAADENGALSGLRYTADRTTNKLDFHIPGFADFTAEGPVPTVMEMAVGDVLRIVASEHFTLNLTAELEGLAATITNLRVRVMEFGGSLGGEEEDEGGPIPMYFNTTEVSDACPDGCTYTIPSGTLALGPVPFGGLDVTIRFTPAGFAANDATVLMEIDGLSAVHAGQTGIVHCAPGTALIADTILDITLTGALCAQSNALSDLRTETFSAPPAVEDGTNVVHGWSVRNGGPSTATNLALAASFEGDLGAPTPTCSAGGVVAIDPGAGTARCTWAGNTTLNTIRTITLTWPTDGTSIGKSVDTTFAASATTAGTKPTVAGSTTVYDSVAQLTITGVSATPAVVAGDQDIVHRVDLRNDGPAVAPNLRLEADVTGAPGAPTITCSEDGVAGEDGCTWPGDTPSGGTRWAELLWTVPAGTPAGTLEAGYLATSDADALDATASGTTAIAAEVANLSLFGLGAPDRVQPGMAVDHGASVRNDGPSAAQNLRLLADYDGALGIPVVLCSDGGSAAVFPEIARARCTWLGATTPGGEQSMELLWMVPADHEIPVAHRTRFQATSSTAGARAEGSVETLVADPVTANLELTALNAPATSAAGGNLVHSATARNNGPEPAENMRITAALPSLIAAPAVACGTGGSSAIEDGVATCTYAGETASGSSRTITLTWTQAAVGAVPVGETLTVDHTASSDTNGTPASGSTSTLVEPVTANLSITNVNVPSHWATGATLARAVTVRNDGPAPASGVVITAQLSAPTNPALATGQVACGTGGTAAVTGGTTVTCTYAASTAVNATRTMTITLTTTMVANTPVGTVLGIGYSAASPLAGTQPVASATTEIVAAVANMTVTGGTNPATVASNAQLVQSVNAQRTGPSAATNMKIVATVDPSLPQPVVTCSTGGASSSPAASTFQCLWAGATSGTTTRTLTLTWSAALVGSAGVGTVLTSEHTVSSDTVGSTATASRAATVTDAPPPPTSELQIMGVVAPETATIGGPSLVHVVDARNAGPTSVNPFILLADHDGSLGNPTVTCSSGGTATPSVGGDSLARCQWGATTTAENNLRTMTLTWAVPGAAAPADFEVTYTATSTSVAVVVIEDQLVATTALVAAEGG